MARPPGITFLSFVLIFIGAATAIFGVTLIGRPGSITDMGIPPQYLALGSALGAVLVISGIINVVVGWGLLKLLNWARVAMLVIAGFGVAGAALGILLPGVANNSIGTDLQSLVAFAIDGLIIWYLLRPESKQAFTPRRHGEQPGAPPLEPPAPPTP